MLQKNKNKKNESERWRLDRETSSDEEVLAASVSNPSAFGILVDRYQASFIRSAMKVVRQNENAQDVAQETFIKIYRNAGKFRKMEGVEFKSWAYKILLNTAFNHYKKMKKEYARNEQLNPVYHEYVLAQNYGDTEKSDLERKLDRKGLVAKVLVKLPRHLGGVLKKFYMEDKSQAKIAEEEGVSVTAVKMRLFRAKKEFKRIAFAEESFSAAMI
ncbi:MAG: sigma-70 family RNA polymerase sigma factor [Candidatus Pacebacteria bacterium]|nr:sigma-70 family RNA polymerase sigma factor [Candidatus Paceibacterota bacterium]